MALDPTSALPTPPGYATPQQIAMAEALMRTRGSPGGEDTADMIRALLRGEEEKNPLHERTKQITELMGGNAPVQVADAEGKTVVAGADDPKAVAGAVAGPRGLPGPGGVAAAVNDKIARLIAIGVPVRDAIQQVEAATMLAPKYGADKFGNQIEIVVGRPPRYTGNKVSPGEEGTVKGGPDLGEVPTITTFDPVRGTSDYRVRYPGSPETRTVEDVIKLRAKAALPKYEKDEYGNYTVSRPGEMPQAVPTGPATPGKLNKMPVGGGVEVPYYTKVNPVTGETTNEYALPKAPGAPVPGSTAVPSIENATSIRAIQDANAAAKAHEVQLTKEAEEGAKTYTAQREFINKVAEDAHNELPQLKMLEKIIGNPQMYSGFMAKEAGVLAQIANTFGLSNTQMASLQAFAAKLGAAASLTNIREMGQSGAGAVKVPEMHMVEKSNFSNENPIESNAAVVKLRIKLLERHLTIANMADDYAAEHGRIDAGFSKQVRAFYKENPLLSPDEIKYYDQMLMPSKPTAGEPGSAGKGKSSYKPGDTETVDFGGKPYTIQVSPDGKGWIDTATGTPFPPTLQQR